MSVSVPAAVAGPWNWKQVAIMRRLLLSLLVLGQTLAGVYVMLAVLPYHGGNPLELAVLALFSILFAWVSVGFWTAVFGFVLRRRGGDPWSLAHRHSPAMLAATPLVRTAVVMPVYNEPVDRVLAGLRATVESLRATGHLDCFDFFVLSDSRDPDQWLAERAGWYRLCRELGLEGQLFYRHRPVNLNYKSGNIADFLRRCGSDYPYMVVLDADSVLGGETLVRMVRHMERAPEVGILQTSPALINAHSAFARCEQFANRVYGPLFLTGLASIQLGEGAYLGHNAIIRTRAFMAHCGLRHLRGFGLFRGPIMSHDFVEAAYMGRAGYEVWLEPELDESYEESPPTLVDELVRDRRWARGNIQHAWILLFAPGLRFAHRMAFLNGILTYVTPLLWLVFLGLNSIEATRLTLWPIDYFPRQEASLFPLWPEWHPHWAVGLILCTFCLLFLPKCLGLIDIALRGHAREYGGLSRLGASVAVESLISLLLAPIRMLAHARYVLEALLNFSLQWKGQNRTEETRWSEALVHQAPGTVLGLCWSTLALWLDPVFFLWSLPVALPLILATPTSVVLSRRALGRWLRDHRLLLTPEERTGHAAVDQVAEPARLAPGGLSGFEAAVLDPELNSLHRHLARRRRCRDPAARRYWLKLCLEHGPGTLDRRQRNLVARDEEALAALHQGAWRAPPDSYWGRRITRILQGGYR